VQGDAQRERPFDRIPIVRAGTLGSELSPD
jgi:hypothetical protein